jgi:hypothetical protein
MVPVGPAGHLPEWFDGLASKAFDRVRIPSGGDGIQEKHRFVPVRPCERTQQRNEGIRRNPTGNAGVVRGKDRENTDRVVADGGIRIHDGMEKRRKLIRALMRITCDPRSGNSFPIRCGPFQD